LERDRPTNIPLKYESKKGNFYSFVKRHNALYDGHGVVVKQNVSHFLKAPPVVRRFSTFSHVRYCSIRSISRVVKML
jgi:hypothetical protein